VGHAAQIIFLLGMIMIMTSYVGVRRYTQENPQFCQSCHEVAPEVAAWLESEHRDIHCQACHHPTMEEGLEILWVYSMGEMPDIQHAEVGVDSCESCHASHDTRWPEVVNSTGHRTHITQEGLSCTECHGQQMHFGQPAREVCLSCHEGKDAGKAHEPSHCLACHNYLSTEEEELLPSLEDCMRCHEEQDMPIFLPDTAPMHFVCSGCHEPHSDGRIAPCEDCHRESEIFGLHEHPDHQLCGDCHEPHGWSSKNSHCLDCHETYYSGHYPERKCKNCHSFEGDEDEQPMTEGLLLP
jgi:hypothetical protein